MNDIDVIVNTIGHYALMTIFYGGFFCTIYWILRMIPSFNQMFSDIYSIFRPNIKEIEKSQSSIQEMDKKICLLEGLPSQEQLLREAEQEVEDYLNYKVN